MAEKRRLPVVQPKPDSEDDDVEPRPPWQWVAFGVVGIFGAWLPLAWIGQALGLRLARARLGDLPDDLAAIQQRLTELPKDERGRIWVSILSPQVFALALAALAGGYLVGRWGQGAGVRAAAVAAALVSVVAGMLSCSATGAAWTALAVAVVAVPCAAGGGRLGVRATRKAVR
jgi:tRNA-(ms[2]io[6]A)-hydroxylase